MMLHDFRTKSIFQRGCLAWGIITTRLLVVMWSALAKLSLFLWGVRVGRGLRVSGPIRIRNAGCLKIGKRVRLNSGPRLNYVGGDRRIALWIGSQGDLEIGDDCGISNSTIICTHSVSILEGTLIGGGCDIYDTDFHELTPESRARRDGSVGKGEVKIGPRAFVGSGCRVLKGVTIGEGAVIGAGSVVTRDVPSFEIWAGVPAKHIRTIRETA